MDRKIDSAIINREKRRRYIRILLIVAAVVIVAVCVPLCFGKSIKDSTLTYGVAEEGPLEITIPAQGKVVAANEEIVNSPVESRIVRVYVKPGDSVELATPLIELDLEEAAVTLRKMSDQYQIKLQELRQLQLTNRSMLNELSLQIEVKQMELNGLRIDLENERKLDSIGSGTGERIRQAETALKAANLQLEQLRSRLSDERERAQASECVKELEIKCFERDLSLMERTLEQGRVPSPRSGVVTYVRNEVGSRVVPGERLAVVSDLSQFGIEGEVPEGNSSKVAIGSRVRVRIGTTELQGNVTNVAPRSQNNMVAFTIRLDDPSNAILRPGGRAELYVAYGYKERVLRIPAGSYFKGAGETVMFVQTSKDELERRKVTLGDSNRDYIEVRSGLRPGEKVVLSDLSDYVNYSKLKLK